MKKRSEDVFTRYTSGVSLRLGHAWVFIAALGALILWGMSGPFLGFSNTWQLIINTSTTIVTFLMVFIIQNTQNRDNLALNLKLDVIMRKMGLDQDDLIDAEKNSDKILEKKVKNQQRESKK